MEKDIIISINAGNGSVYKSADALGINGENINGQIIVEFFNGDFVDGSGNLEIEKADGTKGYFAMTNDKETKTYRLDIRSSLLDVTGKINCQVHITQTKKGGEIPVFKSVIFGLDVIAAIGATTEIQADSPDWCDTVDSRLEALEQNRPNIPSGEADLFYVDLDGKFPTYTCTTPMEDIKSAYNAGRELKCRCAMGDYIAVLPLFVPMPLANTWLFSGSGAISAQGMDFPAQTFTVAIANGNVVAQNTRLAPKNKMLTVNVGNTSYTYDGSQETNITITDATEVSY